MYKYALQRRASISRTGVEGLLAVLSPSPFLAAYFTIESGIPPLWRFIAASTAALFLIAASATVVKRPFAGRVFLGLATATTIATALPVLLTNPFAALAGSVLLITVTFALFDTRESPPGKKQQSERSRALKRARWGTLPAAGLVILDMIFGTVEHTHTIYIILASSVISHFLIMYWMKVRQAFTSMLLPAGVIFLYALLVITGHTGNLLSIILGINILSFILIPGRSRLLSGRDSKWDIVMQNPARLLLFTFLALCTAGTVILLLPLSSAGESIEFVDAAFTSVSAVCVTGLIVLDTPNDFSFAGQFVILLLIQLGGLGIMSIAAVALQAMGHRFSIKQEQLLSSLTDDDQLDLMQTIGLIVKFTLIVETIGALLLTLQFWLITPDGLPDAVWRGIFTAVSAFCNAGFALQTNSLIPYQSEPLILNTVSILIVLGGIAPATSLLLPRWLRGQSIPVAAQIALGTTAVLLIGGTFWILALEWNGTLAGFSIAGKLQNAWFQSVTLRTAGFNSIDTGSIANPTFLVMLAFMFIGGSPGGTAGGIKTTTVGIIVLTFWSKLLNHDDVVIRNRRIRSGTIYQTITIIGAFLLFWFLAVLMLEITQQIPARDIIFEVTSALGTVGLSTGATPLLDEIGKIIIIITMFAGRIGPLTLFMILTDDNAGPGRRYPNAKISLT